MRPALIVLSLLIPVVPLASAQSSPDLTTSYQDAANKLIDAAMQDTAGYEKLTYLCDRIGNRLSGSQTLPKAISWAAEQMKKDGFVNVFTPPVMVPKWVRGAESASITAPIQRPLHMLGLGMSVGTPVGGITAPVAVVSSFDELTALGEKVKGKIVLYDVPYEGYGRTVAYRVAGPSRAAKLGAVAVLVRSITPLAMQMPHTGTTRYTEDAPKIPAAAISPEDAMLLHRLSMGSGSPSVHLEMAAHQEADVPSANVVGEIPGTEHPEEVVVMGGHIDSWDVGQGAQDDGSGIMATMEAARLIHQLNLKPKRTIRVVFWVNEENGERGGEAYLQWIGDKLKNHVAAIEMDSGAEEPKGFGYGAFAGPRRPMPGQPAPPAPQPSPAQQASQQICAQIAKLLTRINAGSVAPYGGGSDIEPIVAKGVPSLSPSTSGAHYFDWHHTQADTLDKVNLQDFRKNIAVLAVLSYVLADMPGRLAGSAAE
jgi:hypothetical protein